MAHSSKAITIAYFLNAFPQLSETFVLNEILWLKKQGVNVLIFSLRHADEGVTHKEAEALISDTTYVCDKGKKAKIPCLVRLLLTKPLRLFKTVRFVKRKNDKRLIWSFKQAIYLAAEVTRLSVQHIHAHFALEASEHAMLVGMLTGIPYSFTAHAIDIYVHQRMLRDKMNYTKFVVTGCNYNKKYLIQYNPGFPGERIHIIKIGVNPDAFTRDNKPTETEKSGDGLHIVSVARLVEKKGFSYLIDALGVLKRKGLKFQATIVGGGPKQRTLADLIQWYKLGSVVHLAGPKDTDEVKTLLRTADVFVLPCIITDNGDRDATPTALIEAMAMEVPIISTTVAGIPEIVPRNAGILVPPKDSMALAKAIETIYQMGNSERKAMGANGREHVLQYCNLVKETKSLAELFLAK